MNARRVESEADRRARYAAKDVTDKLGIKPGQRIRVVGQGDPLLIEKIRVRGGAHFADEHTRAELILFWPQSTNEVTPVLKKLKRAIIPGGGIWVISAKKGHADVSRTPYLPDSILIPLGLAAGLVDNKICSVSDHESAMRFVIRRKDRNQ